MQTCFAEKIDQIYLAILDCIPYEALNSFIITRINVPLKHRTKGYGRLLLKRCIEAADAEDVELWVQLGSSWEQFDNDALRQWYGRHGFKSRGFIMCRPRRSQASPAAGDIKGHS